MGPCKFRRLIPSTHKYSYYFVGPVITSVISLRKRLSQKKLTAKELLIKFKESNKRGTKRGTESRNSKNRLTRVWNDS